MFKKYSLYSLVILFAYTILQTLVMFSFAKLFNVDLTDEHSFINGDLTGLTILISAIVGSVMVIDACKRLKENYIETLSISPFKSKDLIISLLAFILFFILLNWLSEYIPDLQDDFAEKLFKSSKYPVLLFLGIGIAGPIFEELFFRGFLINTFNLLNKSVHFSVLVSSVIFAIVHAQYNLAVTIAIIPFGLILGYSRVYSKSIIPSIIIHVLNNTITIAAFYL